MTGIAATMIPTSLSMERFYFEMFVAGIKHSMAAHSSGARYGARPPPHSLSRCAVMLIAAKSPRWARLLMLSGAKSD
jgi:hypothetical protein